MKVFKKPNISAGWKCPVCKKSDNEEVVLIGIVGTQEGNNIQAEQFHLKCLDLLYDKTLGFIYQKLT